MNKKLSTQPYKGSRDFYPADMRVRNYIFDTWREVCKSYGYEEYDGPFLEPFDLYAAKSGEELVNEQLYSFEDKGGRKVAIRPEMTPTLARMVAGKYKELDRPIRWFCIPNFWRYEKPQKGRLREFFQLNIDVLGVSGPEADFEVLSIAIDIMKRFGADEKMFELRINDRRFMEAFYADLGLNGAQITGLNKILDKKTKLPEKEFADYLSKDSELDKNQLTELQKLLDNPTKILQEYAEKGNEGAKSVNFVLIMAEKAGTERFIKFDPSIVRGLDYYTGTVFEQFDLTPDNNRAMFGGGRYDGLVSIFVDEEIPATGLAIGDVTFLNFLESWNLLPTLPNQVDYLITRWPGESEKENKQYAEVTQEVARVLREEGNTVETWLDGDTKLDKQLKYADKKGVSSAVIVGPDELKKGEITIKDLKTGKQETKLLQSSTS